MLKNFMGNIGIKLCWTGLAIILTFPTFGAGGVFNIIGAIVLVVGVILTWLDK